MNAASSPFQFTTDTATLCLFDIEALASSTAYASVETALISSIDTLQ
ncbi:hypothetical protein P4H71_05520 [Paenibacillus kribbensis]|nr:hypothetical protein [Paenibacillus kribbensis]MEC0233814.1 hypothetical protein [Paenibacillus kribbensis]